MQLCLVQSFYFKLRSMIPCCLCHLNFTVAVPEEELIQVTTGHDLPNKWLEAKMQNSLTLATSFCLPGDRYCSCHDLWQGPDSGEATRQIHLQRSVCPTLSRLGFFHALFKFQNNTLCSIIISVFSQYALATQNPTITFYFVFVGAMSAQSKLCNLFSGCSETEEQLQFPLELCTESSTNTQPSSKISGSHFLIDTTSCSYLTNRHCTFPPLTL